MTKKVKKTGKEQLEEIARADAVFAYGTGKYDGDSVQEIRRKLLRQKRLLYDIFWTTDDNYSILTAEVVRDPHIRQVSIDEIIKAYYLPEFFRTLESLEMDREEVQ